MGYMTYCGECSKHVPELCTCLTCDKCIDCLWEENNSLCYDCYTCEKCAGRCAECKVCLKCLQYCEACNLCIDCCPFDWGKITAPFEGYDYVIPEPTLWQQAVSRVIGCYDQIHEVTGMRYDRQYKWGLRLTKIPQCAAEGTYDERYLYEFLNALPIADEYFIILCDISV